MLLQKLWSRGYEWHDIMVDETSNRNVSWIQQMEFVPAVRVPRCLRKAKEVKKQSIVTFVDTSLKAYGAIMYLLCEYEDLWAYCRMITNLLRRQKSYRQNP